MADEPEVIRDQMQETRTALTEKLEALEQTVAQTVQNTTTAVSETVQSVKDAVEETVGTVKDTVQQTVDTVSGAAQTTAETVKETFNLSRQVERHPWMMMFGSVAVGYLVGRMLPETRDMIPSSSSFPGNWGGSSLGQQMAASQVQPGAAYTGQEPRSHNGHRGQGEGAESRQEPETGESWVGGLLDTYRDEIHQLQGLGVAAVVGVIRDLVTQNVQGEIGSRLGEWMNSLTEKLGGRPLTEPVMATSHESSHSPEPASTGGPSIAAEPQEAPSSGRATRGTRRSPGPLGSR